MSKSAPVRHPQRGHHLLQQVCQLGQWAAGQLGQHGHRPPPSSRPPLTSNMEIYLNCSLTMMLSIMWLFSEVDPAHSAPASHHPSAGSVKLVIKSDEWPNMDGCWPPGRAQREMSDTQGSGWAYQQCSLYFTAGQIRGSKIEYITYIGDRIWKISGATPWLCCDTYCKKINYEKMSGHLFHIICFTVLVIFICLFGFVIFQIVVWVCFQLMMLTKLTVMVAEIRQVRLRVQSLNRPQVAWELLTTSRLSPKLTQEYIVLISCVIYCFNVSSTSSK